MTTYFVATRFRYVLLDADDESQACELGRDRNFSASPTTD